MRLIMRAAFVWAFLTLSLVGALTLEKPISRAVIGMAWGLLLLWCVLGGWLMFRFKERVRDWAARQPMRWQLLFVLMCTVLALTEEAITTTMTNLAPLFGVPVGKAYITASANYLDVVMFHSVVVFVPMFIGWAWLLSRWSFTPEQAFVLFGTTGTLAESLTFGPQNLLNWGFWMWVYGLMIYLPAYACAQNKAPNPPRLGAILLTQCVPVLVAPVALVIHSVHPTQIHFPPIQE
ncbi:MAG: hypothetical protein KIT45_14280 [Fimbriimonadia bacterium]|nr:hypothetical protein [Fimbriimonadia bacterium]